MLWTVHATCMGTLGGDEAAPQLQVLDRYFLPEAVWLAGPWDSAACSCSGDADSAMETSEVTCSRGSWLLCSGISVDAACSLGHGPLLLHASWHGEDVADVTLTSQK
eukprot:s945_g5.t1